jgi:hypothetical protein
MPRVVSFEERDGEGSVEAVARPNGVNSFDGEWRDPGAPTARDGHEGPFRSAFEDDAFMPSGQ